MQPLTWSTRQSTSAASSSNTTTRYCCSTAQMCCIKVVSPFLSGRLNPHCTTLMDDIHMFSSFIDRCLRYMVVARGFPLLKRFVRRPFVLALAQSHVFLRAWLRVHASTPHGSTTSSGFLVFLGTSFEVLSFCDWLPEEKNNRRAWRDKLKYSILYDKITNN